MLYKCTYCVFPLYGSDIMSVAIMWPVSSTLLTDEQLIRLLLKAKYDYF